MCRFEVKVDDYQLFKMYKYTNFNYYFQIKLKINLVNCKIFLST